MFVCVCARVCALVCVCISACMCVFMYVCLSETGRRNYTFLSDGNTDPKMKLNGRNVDLSLNVQLSVEYRDFAAGSAPSSPISAM